MARRPCSALAAAAAGVAVSLQGCSLEKATTTTTAGPTTITVTETQSTSTTTTHHARTPPMTPQEAAAFLNKQYLGFDAADDSSPLGLTISVAAMDESFYKNIFCHSFDNPVLGQTGCSKGRADCRMSASLYNHKMAITENGTAQLGMGRVVGFVFNQSMVESHLVKCSYIWDGASQLRYNNGCGKTALTDDCSHTDSAYQNDCPSTNKTCTAKDEEVQKAFCQEFGGEFPIPETHVGYPQCLFPGAAIDYHGQAHWEPGANNLRAMVKARVARNNGSDTEGPNLAKWNEVVIDERLLMPEIWYDPAVVVPAFVYTMSDDPQYRRAAEKMRDEFMEMNLLDELIPVIALNGSAVVSAGEGPFVAEDDEEDLQRLVV